MLSPSRALPVIPPGKWSRSQGGPLAGPGHAAVMITSRPGRIPSLRPSGVTVNLRLALSLQVVINLTVTASRIDGNAPAGPAGGSEAVPGGPWRAECEF